MLTSCGGGDLLPVLGSLPCPAPLLLLRARQRLLLRRERVALLPSRLLLLLLRHRQPSSLQPHVCQVQRRLSAHFLRPEAERVLVHQSRAAAVAVQSCETSASMIHSLYKSKICCFTFCERRTVVSIYAMGWY